jgi:hypothetical protein
MVSCAMGLLYIGEEELLPLIHPLDTQWCHTYLPTIDIQKLAKELRWPEG